MKYHGFPSRLHHEVPNWVEPGALFHIRIRIEVDRPQRHLTDAMLGTALLDSARFYETNRRWRIGIFLLMPDHLHAILSFGGGERMSDVVGDWKRFQMTQHGVHWQQDYFDHRLRSDERGEQLAVKFDYIRRNPVAAGLCAQVEDWPWVIDSSTA